MIILDTNVISALMRDKPAESVEDWLNRQPRPSVWTTSITMLEARYGIELLPAGGRRERLAAGFAHIVAEALGGRIIDFGAADAEKAAKLMADGRAAGRPIEFRDAMIAGIALTRRARLATHNTKHFQDIGLDLVDPEAEQPL